MIVFELSDILRSDVLDVKYHSIFFKGYGTYFLKCGYNRGISIAYIVTKKINIQCRTCGKPFIGIHKSPSFEVEIVTVTCL